MIMLVVVWQLRCHTTTNKCFKGRASTNHLQKDGIIKSDSFFISHI